MYHHSLLQLELVLQAPYKPAQHTVTRRQQGRSAVEILRVLTPRPRTTRAGELASGTPAHR